MKYCPICHRDYNDDSLRFCLDDGTSLTKKEAVPTAPAPTLVFPAPQENRETLSHVRRPEVPAAWQPGLNKRHPDDGQFVARSGSGSSKILPFTGALLVLGLLLVVGGLGLWGMAFGRRMPMLVLCLAGLVVAMVYSKRNPKASLLTALGLGLYLLQAFVYTGFVSWLQKVAQTLHYSYVTLYTVVGVLNNIAIAAVIVLMVAAAFSGRPSKTEVSY